MRTLSLCFMRKKLPKFSCGKETSNIFWEMKSKKEVKALNFNGFATSRAKYVLYFLKKFFPPQNHVLCSFHNRSLLSNLTTNCKLPKRINCRTFNHVSL